MALPRPSWRVVLGILVAPRALMVYTLGMSIWLIACVAVLAGLRDGGQQPGDCEVCITRHNGCTARCNLDHDAAYVACKGLPYPERLWCEWDADAALTRCLRGCDDDLTDCWTELGCPVAASE